MSYAVRNTIVLLITLFLFAGGTFFYTGYVQQGKIEKLTKQAQTLNTDLRSKQQINTDFPQLLSTYEHARDIVAGYDKDLFKNNSSYGVYEYLNNLTEGSLEVFYDFVFTDSTTQGEYGIINSTIQGIGSYFDLVTFINRLEYGRLINKVGALSITPASGEDNIDYVSFNFTLASYYQRTPFNAEAFDTDADSAAAFEPTHYNPFRPLILASVPPNEEKLTEIESSRILGITGSRVFILDQEGKPKTLSIGDRVFMGYLKSINTATKQAVFNLDKGGIQETFTLTIER